MPTSAMATFGAGMLMPIKNPEFAPTDSIRLKPSQTFAAYTVVGQVTGQAYYGAYASTNVDGTQIPTHILMYACKTDASGNITLGDGTAGQEWGQTQLSIGAYRAGEFANEDIANLDAGFFTNGYGVQKTGVLATGRFAFLGA